MAEQTFYAQQSANRRNSVLLALIVVALLAVLGFAIGYALTGDPVGAAITTGIAVFVGFLVSIGSYFGGDKLVLAASGAKPVDETTAPQLINVVREMTIAANVPMPNVYLIDDTAPNAFATGRDPKHASVAITTGLLEKLDREELQGVIGHELAHVQNYDIRFALLVGVLVGSVALLADMMARMAFWGGMSRGSRRGSGSSGGAGVLIFFLGLLLAILAPIFARLVQMAVNRQ